ncbi:MAG: hypothetical protein DCF23_09205 [Cyanobium sp.]|nr:MAG: hypothetical protein DCF23_09205 [Cyanobium sp.]
MVIRLGNVKQAGVNLCLRFPAAVSFFVSVFLYFPPLWVYLNWGESSDRYGLMMQQARDPFGIVYDTVDNVLAYRLAVPLFNHFVGLRGHAIVLPSLFGSLFLCFLLHRIFRRKCDPVTSFILTICASLTFLVVSGTTCWVATDSLACGAVAAILFSPGLIATTLLSFLALTLDERAIVSLLLLPSLAWALSSRQDLKLRFIARQYFYFLPAILLVMAFRALIDSGVVFPAPLEHYQYEKISNLFWQLETYHPTFILYGLIQWFAAFRWFWIFPVLAAFMVVSKHSLFGWRFDQLVRAKASYRLFLAHGLLILGCYFLVNLSAGDQWRCALYVFPFILASALLVCEANPPACRQAGLVCLGLLVVTPQFFLGHYWGAFFEATSVQIVYPMPLVLARTLFGLGAN